MMKSLPFLFATLGASHAFTATHQQQSTRNMELAALRWSDDVPSEKSRRSVFSAAIVAGASVLFTKPAFSDVSDGTSLPQGAAQFSRLLKVKNDLAVSDPVYTHTAIAQILDSYLTSLCVFLCRRR